MNSIRILYLYDDPDSPGLDIDYLGGYVAAEAPGLDVGIRTDFLTHHFGRFPEEQRDTLEQELQRQLEGARLSAHIKDDAPEISGLDTDPDEAYIGRFLQAALRLLIPEDESGPDHLHCLFLSQLVTEVTEAGGVRAGVACLGAPTLISTSGLVEAPRRPREYYFRRNHYAMLGAADHAEILAEQFADRTVEYGDPRINELLKGYLLMALVYRATGDGPCSDLRCPLYAAQTQQQLLAAQVGEDSRICDEHRDILDDIAGG